MANLYYNAAAVDMAWDELGNWWNDASFTTPAAALPTTGDTVHLNGDMLYPPSTPVTLAHIYVSDISTGTGYYQAILSGVIGNVTVFRGGRVGGQITGDATFYNNSSAGGGRITGNATFNDICFNECSEITGDATFNDYSIQYGFCDFLGNLTFNDYSVNAYNISVAGNTTFNDRSYNTRDITGNATFNNNSRNLVLGPSGRGSVIGNATFNNSSINDGGTITGDATFNDNSSCIFNYDQAAGFRVSGITTFNGPYAIGRIGAGTSYGGEMYVNMTLPAPTSSGGDNTIARLLDLPWFINL